MNKKLFMQDYLNYFINNKEFIHGDKYVKIQKSETLIDLSGIILSFYLNDGTVLEFKADCPLPFEWRLIR